MAPVSLKVITYNVHKGFSLANRRFVLHQMRDHLHNANVDIAFLQEIQGQHDQRAVRIGGWPTETQFEFLADRVWPHYAYGKNAIYDAGHHGNAILSKYPFLEWENINVSSMRFASRSLLHGVIHFPGRDRRLHAICIHLDLMAHERRRQVSLLNERIRQHVPTNEPLILAGDFNDWRGRVGEQLATELELSEIFQLQHGRYARTFPAPIPFLPVDRIYYRGIKPVDSQCLTGSPWHQLSDHLPLLAEFEFEA